MLRTWSDAQIVAQELRDYIASVKGLDAATRAEIVAVLDNIVDFTHQMRHPVTAQQFMEK